MLVLAGPAMAQKQILQDRPVTMETLLDRIQIEERAAGSLRRHVETPRASLTWEGSLS
ncbi:MAG TPA: hypothetical protein VFO31_04760 [Vicinamibacterales bacterium]|nr:hypothetical protein [Vicinamibacterales bacterium]